MKEPKDKRTKAWKEWNASKGLGDKVADVTDALGIKKCKGCEERQESLNLVGHQLEYFFKKHKPNPFTQEDIIQWETFINIANQNQVSTDEQKLIVRLLKDVLNMSVKPCATCNGKVWVKYIKMIQTVYNNN